jgi:mono/diheme cytochrome c family protein
MAVSSLKITRRYTALLLAACIAPLVGCGTSPPPRFHSNLVQMAANNISLKHQRQIADILDAMFGTPDEPFVLPETGLDLQKIQMAAGPAWSDPHGVKRGLFRVQCVHCHGITGDGMGPTALFLKPYPRDYRQGLYKFKSTLSNAPPTHDDLMHTLSDGIPGTNMPTFKLLSQAERESLVEYVRYLSMRGQMELALISYVSREVDEDQDVPRTREILVDESGMFGDIAGKWKGADSQLIQVPPPPADFGTTASIDLGRKVFLDKGGCVKCHGPTELGDGQVVLDDWNKAIDDLTKSLANREAKLSDMKDDTRAEETRKVHNLAYALAVDSLPPRESQPRNLRQGIFRGGRQPYVLFYRVSNGITGANMPGIATTQGITPDDMWHVVDFVLDLPYEPGSQYHTDSHMQTAPRERL